MGTKERIIAILEEKRGSYFSGEELAERLSVSRTAVWKAINSLRDNGYEIEAVTKKGYRLAEDTDQMSEAGIRKYISREEAIHIEVQPVVTSTNTLLYEKAAKGQGEGYVLLAGAQTAGRGRQGHTFYSPKDTGIYMSLLLRPKDASVQSAARITSMAAVAVCEAVEAVTGQEAGIKWVNDIFMNGRKVSGILTEASIDMENGNVAFVVLGIGVNLYKPKEGFPEDIQNIAGAAFSAKMGDAKNRLAAEIIQRFWQYYKTWDKQAYTEKYREKSLVIGKEVTVLLPEGKKKARVLTIDDECHLVVRYEDGKEDSLSSGEISIKME
ncbi:BirA family transcriptional regulator, biotin operon repressor / biotin-[acetyl-CoA-carboxylase] ligase [Lachnospiraceae bacterium XBB1006]|nr:BirA family transcriptional regulator, biotin operon repressor / biotin-[acetyl-CoA-carboxylase] ligase [Lachnospiraceae bacterium XBB1006]